MVNIYFGSNLKVLRKKEGKSQEDIGLQLHINPKTLSNWETKKSFPNFEQLAFLSQYLRISIDDFLLTDLSKEEKKHDAKASNIDWEAKYKVVEKLYMDCKIEAEMLKKSKQKTA